MIQWWSKALPVPLILAAPTTFNRHALASRSTTKLVEFFFLALYRTILRGLLHRQFNTDEAWLLTLFGFVHLVGIITYAYFFLMFFGGTNEVVQMGPQ